MLTTPKRPGILKDVSTSQWWTSPLAEKESAEKLMLLFIRPFSFSFFWFFFPFFPRAFPCMPVPKIFLSGLTVFLTTSPLDVNSWVSHISVFWIQAVASAGYRSHSVTACNWVARIISIMHVPLRIIGVWIGCRILRQKTSRNIIAPTWKHSITLYESYGNQTPYDWFLHLEGSSHFCGWFMLIQFNWNWFENRNFEIREN